jgi:hypothetical protein
MYIYDKGKRLINLDNVLVVRVHFYEKNWDYIEFSGDYDTVAMMAVPKGEGRYVLEGIRRLLALEKHSVYVLEELKEYGKSSIERSDK